MKQGQAPLRFAPATRLRDFGRILIQREWNVKSTHSPKLASADRCGFTLIEMMIVLAILSIIAATIFARIYELDDDAEKEVMRFNQGELQKQIDLYKLQHRGSAPNLIDAGLPQLVQATNAAGEIGPPGPAYPFGPYVQGGKLPHNPVLCSNEVEAVNDFPPPGGGSTAGWFYKQSTGQIAANEEK